MKTPCGTCKTQGQVTVKMKDLSGRKGDGFPILGIIACPGCNGKGHVTDEDRKRVQSVEVYNQIGN